VTATPTHHLKKAEILSYSFCAGVLREELVAIRVRFRDTQYMQKARKFPALK
jgi:hypothetical protein